MAARWVIRLIAVDDAKAQVHELAHGGGDSHELGLAACQQALVELALFAGFFSLLALGRSGWPVSAAVWLGIVADLEGLAISVVLMRWVNDVPSVVHAWRLRESGRG